MIAAGSEAGEPDVTRLREAIGRVEDPEIPIRLADLGVLRAVTVDHGRVLVTLRTTRMACPGRQKMEYDIRAAVAAVADDLDLEIVWDTAPWRSTDVSEAGRQALRDFGYAILTRAAPVCPYCGTDDPRAEGSCGGSPCKVPFTCRHCGSPFDAVAGSLGARQATPVEFSSRR